MFIWSTKWSSVIHVKCKESLERTVTKLLKPTTSQTCRCLHLYRHKMNMCIIGISILQWQDSFWVEVSDIFYFYGVWAHKMPGGGVQNITSYIETSSTWLKIWCLVHPDCKEDDGSFVLHRCNQLWETCQQIIASRPATFASLHPYNGPNRKGSNLWHIMVKPCLSRVTCLYFLTLLVVMLISGRAHR